MQTITVSATKARNDFFSVLAWVSSGKRVMIEKDRKPVANIISVTDGANNKGLMKALNKASAGFVYSKTDNPLRKSGSSNFLGKWDK